MAFGARKSGSDDGRSAKLLETWAGRSYLGGGKWDLDSALSPRPSLSIPVCSLQPRRQGLNYEAPNTKPTALNPRPLLHTTDTSHNASGDAPKKTPTDTNKLDPEAPSKKLNESTTTMNNGRVGNLDDQAGVVRDTMLSNLGPMPPE